MNLGVSRGLVFCVAKRAFSYYNYHMKNLETIKDKKLLKILGDVEHEIRQLFGDKLKGLILYGSYARNEQVPESDIDIMILVDDNEEGLRNYRYLIADIMGELTIKYGKLISLAEVTYNRFVDFLEVLPFYKNIKEEGVEIYGKKAA